MWGQGAELGVGAEPILQMGREPGPGGISGWRSWLRTLVLDRGHLRMGSAKGAAQDILPLDEQRMAQNPSGCWRGEALE